MKTLRQQASLRLQRQGGLTLIELMIALLLDVMIVMGAMSVMAGNQKAFRLDEALGNLQETMRFSDYLITSEVREAGFGCLDDVSTVVNTLNSSQTLDYSFGTPLQGYDSTTGYPQAVSADVISGTDVFVIRSAEGTEVTLESEMPDSSAVLKTTVLDPAPIASDDIVLVTDCSSAAVFQVTNYTDANGNIVHNTGNGTPGNATKSFNHSFAAGSRVMKVHTSVYYLTEDDSGRRVLYRRTNDSGTVSTVPLLYGLENMQITYGVDTNTVAGVDSYLEASAVADWNQVSSVRFELLYASQEDNLLDGYPTYTFDGAEVTADDRRLYRRMSFVTALRNRTE